MMSQHEAHHHHHHPAGHLHPPAPIPLSLLRSSVAQRLALAAGLSAVIWLAVYWAIG